MSPTWLANPLWCNTFWFDCHSRHRLLHCCFPFGALNHSNFRHIFTVTSYRPSAVWIVAICGTSTTTSASARPKKMAESIHLCCRNSLYIVVLTMCLTSICDPTGDWCTAWRPKMPNTSWCAKYPILGRIVSMNVNNKATVIEICMILRSAGI